MKKKTKKTARKTASKKKKASKVIKKKSSCKTKKPAKAKNKPKTKIQAESKKTIQIDASLEEIGIVTHYFQHVNAAVIKLTKGALNSGDTIIFKGHTTDFKQKISSMQMDRTPITSAETGQEIGVKVSKKVREHDVVYKFIG